MPHGGPRQWPGAGQEGAAPGGEPGPRNLPMRGAREKRRAPGQTPQALTSPEGAATPRRARGQAARARNGGPAGGRRKGAGGSARRGPRPEGPQGRPSGSDGKRAPRPGQTASRSPGAPQRALPRAGKEEGGGTNYHTGPAPGEALNSAVASEAQHARREPPQLPPRENELPLGAAKR